MAEEARGRLRAEQDQVVDLLDELVSELPEGLSSFVRGEMTKEQVLAGIVLASATPINDSAEALSRRVALAGALELLQIGLNIHQLLLTPVQSDSIDSFLLGGTILAGDYCFSRAAVLAARTSHPQVVFVFAELLKEVSQANLRRAMIDKNAGPNVISSDDRTSLFYNGALAGVLLAELAEEDQALVARFAFRLGQALTHDGNGRFDFAADDAQCGLPPHQRERWRALISSL